MPSARRRYPSLAGDILAAIAAGGALGAVARYAVTSWDGLTRAVDVGWGGVSDGVLIVNAVGSFLMGLLVCFVVRRPAHRLLRPFLGTGFLGGFTTFSTFAYDTRALWTAGESLAAASYLILTPVTAIGACWLGVQAMHRILGWPLPREDEAGDLPTPAEEGTA